MAPASTVLAAWLLLTAALAALLTAAALAYAHRARLLDQPGRRRSHARATPRGGGIGPLLAWLLALVVLPATPAMPLLALAAGTLLVGGIGMVDDHRPLPAWPRLLVHALAAALLVLALRGAPASAGEALVAAALVLGLVALVNFWNFMDGIDGLAAMQSAFVAAGLAAILAGAGALLPAIAAALLAAAVLGFLPFNAPRAHIFLGDVGSGGLGFACGGLLVWAWHADALAWPAALLLASAFLLDAGLTLLARMLARRRWYTAHREHLYQWLVRRGLPHARVVAFYLGWNLLIVTPLVVAVLSGRLPAIAAVVVAFGGGTVLWALARRALLQRARRYGVAP